MNTLLLGLLAETFIHVGGGQSDGAIDLPVAREAVTDYPFIPGSGLKGALRDWSGQRFERHASEPWFGKQQYAGQLLFSDARLLALPVRSLHGASRWVTCPHLLERCRRDMLRLGLEASGDVPMPAPGTALGVGEGRLILEERGFDLVGLVPEAIATYLGHFVPHADSRARLVRALVILHDEDFTWFARYGLPVQARNVLEEATKASKNLWYEEALPPDSLLYTLIGTRGEGIPDQFTAALRAQPFVQVGGNETIGQGWLALTFPEPAP